MEDLSFNIIAPVFMNFGELVVNFEQPNCDLQYFGDLAYLLINLIPLNHMTPIGHKSF
ncbi:hypothetical protein SAMN05216231_0448 [Virgibacillus salinus]|uniref:Uncharacterized protein n=1 Tax=Virgibacillus salinus TaxID=553311 RepID=A0A1H0Y678_9BACI|nr:hypothetical protein SAMN05216231_0448 [Virgibacillus salinus]